MDFQLAALTICGAIATYVWYRHYRSSSIRDIPGPTNPSWIYGHIWWWQRKEACAFEKSILEDYGTIAPWNGAFGEQRLWIADPKAIHHIVQSSSHLYETPESVRAMLAIVLGRGVGVVSGDEHKRYRRAMDPAFGLVETKALHPHFSHCSNSLADKWHEIISNTESGQAAIIDVHPWASRTTLDAIGAGVFGYDFGALEDTDNKFTKSYTGLAYGAVGMLSKKHLFIMDIFKLLPRGFTTWLLERDQRPAMVKVREHTTLAHEVAVKLIEDKKQELRDGTSRKDLLSLLVKANSSLRPEWRMNDEEIIAQVRTILFSGHETTTKVLEFAIWELAKDRHIQETLRAEVYAKLRRIRSRGDVDFTVDDYDSMPYLCAVVKEVLRVHPVVPEVTREAKSDDVLPLSKPVLGISGKVYNELFIPAGTTAWISMVGYNLNKDLWGSDAYEFRPERWFSMDEKSEWTFGVYGNLLTFSGGRRSCIAWRFTVIEMRTFLATLIRQFDFSLPENGQEIRQMRPNMIIPVVVGEEHKGPQLPLKVTALRDE